MTVTCGVVIAPGPGSTVVVRVALPEMRPEQVTNSPPDDTASQSHWCSGLREAAACFTEKRVMKREFLTPAFCPTDTDRPSNYRESLPFFPGPPHQSVGSPQYWPLLALSASMSLVPKKLSSSSTSASISAPLLQPFRAKHRASGCLFLTFLPLFYRQLPI